jgi:hypothetical protein
VSVEHEFCVKTLNLTAKTLIPWMGSSLAHNEWMHGLAHSNRLAGVLPHIDGHGFDNSIVGKDLAQIAGPLSCECPRHKCLPYTKL